MTYSLVFVFIAVGWFQDSVSAPTEQYGYKSMAACMEAGAALESNSNLGNWSDVRYVCVPSPVYGEE